MLRLAAAGFVLFASACASGPAAPPAEVRDLRLRGDGVNYPTLTGLLVNTSDRALASADVAVTLYGPDNAVLSDVLVSVPGVAPGDSSRFSRRLDVPATAVRLRAVEAR